MLTRLYVDNYRCFVNFEFRPAKRQLILGSNGSGKSSLMRVIMVLRQIASGESLDRISILGQRTRWMTNPQTTFEVEALVNDHRYSYRLVIDRLTDPLRLLVSEETLKCDDRPLLTSVKGTVTFFDKSSEAQFQYPFALDRSALGAIRPEDDRLESFLSWLLPIHGFRLNPFKMDSFAEGEYTRPLPDLSNFASLYRELSANDPHSDAVFQASIRDALADFVELELGSVVQEQWVLRAVFRQKNGLLSRFSFHELSDGQRCLICLYAIVHFFVAKGATVIIDEPDNFISLREIQPWLMAATDAVDEGNGQLLLISHHPEIINQWAAESGVEFIRDSAGAVRVEPFRGDAEGLLAPSEIIARGWQSD